MKKLSFTLIELMFVISVLIILIGIGLSAGTKVLRAQVAAQRKAEVVVIRAAIESFKLRYGHLPDEATGDIDWAYKLSDYEWDHDYNNDGNINGDDYKHKMRIMNLVELNHDYYSILDPYEEKYQYEKLTDNTFEIK